MTSNKNKSITCNLDVQLGLELSETATDSTIPVFSTVEYLQETTIFASHFRGQLTTFVE